MRFPRTFAAVVLALGWCHSHAQPAMPALTSGAAAQALYSQWFVPQAQQAAQQAQQLLLLLQQYCSRTGNAHLSSIRQQFVDSSHAWQRLSAVAMGPQVERRTARMVDFQPLRLPLLQSALRKAPRNLADMERIGAPAKGFPALEYLLWSDIAPPTTPACDYAVLVAADTAQELHALEQALERTAAQTTLDFEINSEFLNQWVGGVERLRWQAMEKPLRSAKPGKPIQVTRAASGDTLAHWHSQWQALRAQAVGDAATPAMQSTMVAMVQARGWSQLAQQLRDAVQNVDSAMAGIQTIDLASITPASQALAQLKHLVENDVALTLDVSIGFSDADGD